VSAPLDLTSASHNLVFDLLIRGAGQDFLLDQLIFPLIQSPRDELL
jgi:hypothetical protein